MDQAHRNGKPAEAEVQGEAAPRDLILTCNLSPGDVVMLTAAVRDLHLAYPGRYRTDVRTTAQAIWENNPYITPLDEYDPSVRTIAMRYDLIHQSNSGPYHFIHGYVRHLEEELGLKIPVTAFRGDIHISSLEKSWMSQVEEDAIGWHEDFWIIVAGGKYDFTAKWWDPKRYQQVVDHFAGRIQFVQCGEAGHWHPRLKGAIDLVGKTDLRQFIRLMHHAAGVVSPVTFAMHLAAAVEVKPGRAKNRACVVVAGGREPSQWEKYGHHRFLETNGALACCDNGGCWKSRCQPVGDGDEKDLPGNLCILPVRVADDLQIPRCMDLITAADVIRAIELYHDGGAYSYLSACSDSLADEPNHGHTNGQVHAALVVPASPNHAASGRTPKRVGRAQVLPSATAFLTVTDYDYFPGTVATVNSIFQHHPDATVLVVNRLDHSLTEPQRRLLEQGGATILNSDRFEREGRLIGAWELKAYAASELATEYDLLIGIDSDCVLCAGVRDIANRARTSGQITGGKDGDGVTYDQSYAPYGIAAGSHNDSYMSTSLYFCPATPANRDLFAEWARCTNEAEYNGRGNYCGHGDQGILNSLIYARGERADLLENDTWSQHWRYWTSVVIYENGRFLNNSHERRRQRSFHCGGAEKFWNKEHRDRIITSNPAQAINYAWWLYMFWFGRCRDWSIDPALYLPVPSLHLCDDLVNFFGQIRRFSPDLTLYTPESEGLFSRLIEGIRGCMSLGANLDDYIEIVRGLPERARVVEIGSCEGRSVVAVAIASMDRDITFFSVESFTGDDNGTFDGWPLPSLDRYAFNVRTRFPFLWINPVFGKSTEACASFADHSIDAVFIDACHSAENVRDDILCWLPKLKHGGMILGDDWDWDSVKQGVYSVFDPERVSHSRGGYLWVVTT
jgi:hypothetical protein